MPKIDFTTDLSSCDALSRDAQDMRNTVGQALKDASDCTANADRKLREMQEQVTTNDGINRAEATKLRCKADKYVLVSDPIDEASVSASAAKGILTGLQEMQADMIADGIPEDKAGDYVRKAYLSTQNLIRSGQGYARNAHEMLDAVTSAP